MVAMIVVGATGMLRPRTRPARPAAPREKPEPRAIQRLIDPHDAPSEQLVVIEKMIAEEHEETRRSILESCAKLAREDAGSIAIQSCVERAMKVKPAAKMKGAERDQTRPAEPM